MCHQHAVDLLEICCIDGYPAIKSTATLQQIRVMWFQLYYPLPPTSFCLLLEGWKHVHRVSAETSECATNPLAGVIQSARFPPLSEPITMHGWFNYIREPTVNVTARTRRREKNAWHKIVTARPLSRAIFTVCSNEPFSYCFLLCRYFTFASIVYKSACNNRHIISQMQRVAETARDDTDWENATISS